MAGFAAAVTLDTLGAAATTPDAIVQYQTASLLVRALVSACWLIFGAIFARGNTREILRRWRWLLGVGLLFLAALTASLLPGLVEKVTFSEEKGWSVGYGTGGHFLNISLLMMNVVVLTSLEATFRASVGTTRWRIKFVVLGLAVIFGTRIYTRTQALLFSGHSLNLITAESGALLIGSTLLAIAFSRGAFRPLDVYPLRTHIGQSVTVVLVGGYLFFVGVLAQIIALVGDATNFQAQAFLVLVGLALVAVLLVSDRFRQRLKLQFSRYFGRPMYDFRNVWTQFSRQLTNQTDVSSVCRTASRLISETFSVLSVRIWLIDELRQRVVLGASTAPSADEALASADPSLPACLSSVLEKFDQPFNLEPIDEKWATTLRECSISQFPHGGDRFAIPLAGNNRPIGIVVLADRVDGVPYSPEELDLLRCVGAQVSATLLNLRITYELMQAKELEAFQTMSAFFVHDLKNAVSTLNLMLQNLPVHFANPEFRDDALRGIGKTVDRVNHLIARLSALRQRLELRPVESDINELVLKALNDLNGLPGIELTRELGAVRKIFADSEHLRSVLSNLLLNARDAVGPGGKIHVETAQQIGGVSVLVSDTGCGMTREFLETSLFRPFTSTKNKGLGIGMFQCKMIVEAHRGSIRVDSEPGKGTTFRIFLPAAAATHKDKDSGPT
jgi:putative PEP-CTERM system histidine kinase